MSRARELAKLGNPNIIAADASLNVGIGSLTPDSKLDVAGIVSATYFYGDGSNLEGVASAGLGTAINADSTDGLQVIYYTDQTLSVGNTITVEVPTGSDIAYTQYAEIELADNADLIVADGDDFIPDILGLSTAASPAPVTGGRIRADEYTARDATSAPTFTQGVRVTGACTATTFTGDGSGLTGVASTDNIITSGIVTITNTTDSTSATTGALKVSGGIGIAKSVYIGQDLVVAGNVSVAGTLTKEDVTNIDSVGLITARSGIRIGGGTTVGPISGIVTYYGDGSQLTGIEAGISTTAQYGQTGIITLDLSKQNHDIYLAAGISTVTTTGGSVGDSHSVIFTNPSAGIATVGFGTYFLWPSGSPPSLVTDVNAINLVSFIVRTPGAAGIGTQLLGSAAIDYS